MLAYVKEAKEEYIRLIWDGAKKAANRRQSHIVENATVEFLRLYVASRQPVTGEAILQHTGFAGYGNSNSHGLWPWLSKEDNAGVIEETKDGDGKKAYAVRPEFLGPMRQIVLPSVTASQPTASRGRHK